MMRVATRHNSLRAHSLGGKFARSSQDQRHQLQQHYHQLQQQHQQLQQQQQHVAAQLQQQQQLLQQQQQQQLQPQQPQQQQYLQQQQQNQQMNDDAAFASSEPNPEAATLPDQQATSILGDRFLLFSPAEGSTLYRCVDSHTGQQLVAKAIIPGEKSSEALLQAQLRLEGSGAVSAVAGLVDAASARKRYLLLEGHHGDLHAYVRARRRLREPEARRLFRQAAMAVATCHEHGVVLRDLKLRKFVFADEARTKLQLESLEDAVLVEPTDDLLSDRRGCPAYVAPEVLRSGRAYSGKAADIWSLGVLLYTMLVGRYPFNDAEHVSLFAKISRGHFAVPEGLSPRARCLVKALLRREPGERPDAEDVLRHPWLTKPLRSHAGSHHHGNNKGGSCGDRQDQVVPDLSNLQR